MKNSPLDVDWSFNVLDLKDSFHIQGTIANFNVVAMERFTKPYINTSFTGNLINTILNFMEMMLLPKEMQP